VLPFLLGAEFTTVHALGPERSEELDEEPPWPSTRPAGPPGLSVLRAGPVWQGGFDRAAASTGAPRPAAVSARDGLWRHLPAAVRASSSWASACITRLCCGTNDVTGTSRAHGRRALGDHL